METKEKLIKLIDEYRKAELAFIIFKIIPLLIYIILAPVVIWFLIRGGSTIEPGILFLVEFAMIYSLPDLIKDYNNNKSFESCKLIQSVLHPEYVSEIIVYPTKIFIDIKGLENYEVKLRSGKLKDELILCFKEYFGVERVIDFANKNEKLE